MIENLPKGALPDKPDARDFKAALVMGASMIDWSQPYILPEPPNENQGTSLSCVAQAWSYYHWQLRGKDYSRRDIYCQIYLPQGGAYIRDGGLRIVKYGQATRDETSDPNPQTEPGMRDKTGVSLDKEASDMEANSFVLNADIDTIAASIASYKGVVFGVIGTNEGWQNLAQPVPPQGAVPIDFSNRPDLWGHALYLFGYHMHDGQKCLIAKSSWGTNGNTTVHHINETYIKSGFIFNPWTLIPKEQQMTKKFIIQDGAKVGVLVLEGFTGTVAFADNQAHLNELKDAFGVPADAKTIQIPQ